MEQTNRTILFEELNPNKGDLLSFIYDEKEESVVDSTLKEIHDNLEISSFEDCLKKLQPVLYLCLDTGNHRVICTPYADGCRTAGEQGYSEHYQIHFCENYPLLKYFIKMIDAKKGQGDLPDLSSHIVDFMFPVQKEKNFRKLWAKALSFFVSGKTEDSTNEMQKLFVDYDNGLVLIRMLLCLLEEELEVQAKGEVPLPILIEDCEEYQIETAKISDDFLHGQIRLAKEDAKPYEGWVEEIMQNANVRNKELFRHLLNIALYGVEHQKDALQKMYDTYLDYYIRIIESFWSLCRPLLEKLLGIYSFFAQYQVSEAGMQPKLLIANFVPEQVLNEKNKEKLHLYLNSVNGKTNYDNTIWYGIIPRLEYADEDGKADIRERFRGNGKQLATQSNALEGVVVLAEILAVYKIQTFVSPILNRRTEASWLVQHGVHDWLVYEESLLHKESAEYLYPCFPNFTLMSGDYVGVEISGNEDYAKTISANKSGRRKLWLKMIGVEASYVAAGMYAALQCSQYLSERFKRQIDKELPGVSFRILENKSNLKLPATLKSGLFLLSAEVLEEVHRKCCGIFFAPFGSRELIAQDRAMTGMYGALDSVSTVQTLTYIERKIRYETQDFKSTLIERFFQKRPDSLCGKWSQNTGFLNSILKTGEDIHYTLDEERKECVFEVNFAQAKRTRKVFMNQ